MHLTRVSFLLPLLLLVQACALPRTIAVYDPECQIVAREMVLELHDMQVLNSCNAGRNCLDQVAVGLAVLATSTVISGSIVIAGNMIYWLEKQQNCRLKERVPFPSPPRAPVPAAVPAAVPAPVPATLPATAPPPAAR